MTTAEKQILLAIHAKLGAIREVNAGRDETITRFCNEALPDLQTLVDTAPSIQPPVAVGMALNAP